MCIIVYAPAGVKVEDQIMHNCFTANGDGAGIMYQLGSKVKIEKGYMTYKSFIQAWNDIPSTVDRVAHFRIATSGKIEGGNCHPFPVCQDFTEMRKLESYANIGVAHNGILSKYSPQDKLLAKHSDTMAFIQRVIHPLGKLVMKNEIQNLIDEATSNKFAIMTPQRTVLIGNFNQYEGAFYSNYSYMPRTTFTGYTGGGDSYNSEYMISFLVDDVQCTIAETEKKLTEELDYLKAYVLDSFVDGNEILFDVWGLPTKQEVLGYKWKNVSKDWGMSEEEEDALY